MFYRKDMRFHGDEETLGSMEMGGGMVNVVEMGKQWKCDGNGNCIGLHLSNPTALNDSV